MNTLAAELRAATVLSKEAMPLNYETAFPEVWQNLTAQVRGQLKGQSAAPVDERLIRQIVTQLCQASLQRFCAAKLSRAEAQQYWSNPQEPGNLPQDYLGAGLARSAHLLELVRFCGLSEPRILELGCNAGRNLNFLYQAGYRRLSAIEINPQAVALLRETYPELAACAEIHVAPIEDVIRNFADGAFDIIFSLAVLVHVHYDSDWIFPEIARAAGKYVITIEDEANQTQRHFARNYREVFEGLGLRQIKVCDCCDLAGMDFYISRVFAKP